MRAQQLSLNFHILQYVTISVHNFEMITQNYIETSISYICLGGIYIQQFLFNLHELLSIIFFEISSNTTS